MVASPGMWLLNISPSLWRSLAARRYPVFELKVTEPKKSPVSKSPGFFENHFNR
jgi:hypothetical protein